MAKEFWTFLFDPSCAPIPGEVPHQGVLVILGGHEGGAGGARHPDGLRPLQDPGLRLWPDPGLRPRQDLWNPGGLYPWSLLLDV